MRSVIRDEILPYFNCISSLRMIVAYDSPCSMISSTILSTTDISDFAASFRLADIIGDGLITYDELPRVMGRCGEWPSVESLQKIMNTKIDPDGKGLYDFQTFLQIMK